MTGDPSSPMRMMVQTLRRKIVNAANGGKIGQFCTMPIRSLLTNPRYELRLPLLDLCARPRTAFNKAVVETEMYRQWVLRDGHPMAMVRARKYRSLYWTLRQEYHDDRGHAPVLIADDRGNCIRRLDGTHRVSILRFLGHESMPVVTLAEEEYTGFMLEQIPREKVQAEIDKYEKWYQPLEVLPGMWTRQWWDDKEGALLRALPDVRRKRILDMGCNGGLYSFECSRRGATQVDGIDKRPVTIEQAELVHAIWDVTQPRTRKVAFYCERIGECFGRLEETDIVIAACVLYHVKENLYPFLNAVAKSKVQSVIVQGNIARRKKLSPAELERVKHPVVARETPPRLIFEIRNFDQLFTLYGFHMTYSRPGRFPTMRFERN